MWVDVRIDGVLTSYRVLGLLLYGVLARHFEMRPDWSRVSDLLLLISSSRPDCHLDENISPVG